MRVRQLVDAIRTVQVLSLLLGATATHKPYWRVTVSALATEAATLVDLLYEQPPSRRPSIATLPLLELLRAGCLERESESGRALGDDSATSAGRPAGGVAHARAMVREDSR